MSQSTNEPHLTGLTDQEVIASREKNGINLLTPPKRPSIWKLYLEKFQDPVIRVLLVAAVFSLIISIIESEYAETIGIFLQSSSLQESDFILNMMLIKIRPAECSGRRNPGNGYP